MCMGLIVHGCFNFWLSLHSFSFVLTSRRIGMGKHGSGPVVCRNVNMLRRDETVPWLLGCSGYEVLENLLNDLAKLPDPRQ